MPLADLLDPNSGFVVNDTVIVRADVQVKKVVDYWNWDSKKETGFVGLKNQGATCYMNSLLQTLYHIPYFRKVGPHQLTMAPSPSLQMLQHAIDRLYQCHLLGVSGKSCLLRLVPSLSHCHFQDCECWNEGDRRGRSRKRVILILSDASCLRGSGLHASGVGFMAPRLLQAVYHMPTTENDSAASSIPLALQRLFYKLQFKDTSVSTKDLTTSFGWGPTESFEQHDVQELNRILCENLEEKMKVGTLLGPRLR
jgi:hypothetical protein